MEASTERPRAWEPDNGLVVGYHVGSDGQDPGFVVDEKGAGAGSTGVVVGQFTGINALGEVDGSCADASGAMHGFVVKA